MGKVVRDNISFNASEDTSASQLGGAAPTVINAVMDSVGTLRRRPGISEWDAFPSDGASGSAVIGMCPWGEHLVYVTADRKIHSITPAGGGI